MSLIFSSLYLVTNVFTPISFMIYKESNSISLQQPQKQANEIKQTGQSPINENTQTQIKDFKSQSKLSDVKKVNYGKWFLLVITILFFNFLTQIFRKNYSLLFLGMIVKLSVVYLPLNITNMIQQMIQKSHFEVYLQTLRIKLIDWYLQYTWKINSFLILDPVNGIKDKDEKIQILIHFKDQISRMQLQLEENQDLKNKSYIVAEKKLLTIKKSNLKCYQNIGVNCDILKSDQVNRELLKLLSQKKIPSSANKQTNYNPISESHIQSINQQPTNDNFQNNKLPSNNRQQRNISYSAQKQQKPHIKNFVSVQKMKQSHNIKPQNKVKLLKQQQFIIKRSKSDIIDEMDSSQESPSKPSPTIPQKKYKQTYNLTQRTPTKSNIKSKDVQAINYAQIDRKFTTIKSQLYGEQNQMAPVSSKISNNNKISDIQQSSNQNSRTKKTPIKPPQINHTRNLQQQTNTEKSEFKLESIRQQAQSPRVLPPGVSISKIQPYQFQLNLSSLSNPLIPSGNLRQSKILPPSLFMSSSNKQIPSFSQNRGQIKSSIIPQAQNKKNRISNISQVNTQRIGQKFDQQSSVKKELEVSINESQYSDMFQSEGQEETEAILQIKVEAVVQNTANPISSSNLSSTKVTRPRIDICNIQLYSNSQVKFYSVYDKITFQGNLLRMKKVQDNFYELFFKNNKKQQNKQQKEQNKEQIVKKVKFRGQAKPFMKYLQK